MTVKYIQHGEYQGNSMSIGKIYTVLGIENNYYRILNDEIDPCLYNANQFIIIDSKEPDFWIIEIDEDKEKYAYPASWNKAGFFEDYHDGVKNIIHQFWLEYSIYYDSQK